MYWHELYKSESTPHIYFLIPFFENMLIEVGRFLLSFLIYVCPTDTDKLIVTCIYGILLTIFLCVEKPCHSALYSLKL